MVQAGTRLGPYEITSLIGAGGMGEVYRARDTRLDRTVAIKILPTDVCSSAERKQRFEREARAISSLQHPHICVLHDVGSENGIDYLVMEYLEGESLATRVQRGPLPTEEVLKIGAEIASALERAHRQGIVHRDLKPGNVMLTKSGAKLLDFGLAKPLTMSAAVLTAGSQGATLSGATQPITARGTIAGTFQYMSPEQLQGKEADGRSDIFALGALLYEAATGKPAFTGKTQISVMSAILERDPEPITAAKPASPPALDFVVRTCLAKDPDQRFQTAHDVGLQLRWIAGQSASSMVLPAIAPRGRRVAALWVVAAAAVLVAIAAGASLFHGAPTTNVMRFVIPLPEKHTLPGNVGSLAISADGKKIAFVATLSGTSQLYTQALDSFDPVSIPDSDGATYPFFSPDGQWIAFFAHGRLRKAASDGSTNPVNITDLPGAFYGGSWLPNDSILLASNPPLLTLSASGGALKTLPTNGVQVDTGDPILLPGGDWVLFTDDKRTSYDIYKYRMATGDSKLLLANAMQPIYTPGYLVYYSSGSIWAAPFDPKSAELKGPAIVLARDVSASNWFGHFAVSQQGTLIFVPGADRLAARSVVWVDRKGKVTRKFDMPAQDYVDPSISPDGKHFVVCIRTIGEQSLAVYDITRGTMMRMSGNRGRSAAPVWDATGKYLYFDGGDIQGRMALFRIPADGSAAATRLLDTTSFTHITSIAGDKASVMLTDPQSKTDLWIMSLDRNQLTPFRKTAAIERQGSFSPNGKYLAYASDESGRSEIYVESASGSGARWQISINGGDQPRWSRKGNEIFFREGTKMMSAAVQEDPFSASKPVELFDVGYERGGAVAGYDVAPDGQHFLMTQADQASATEIRVIAGWPVELKKTAVKTQ